MAENTVKELIDFVLTDKALLVRVYPFYEDGRKQEYKIFPLSEIEFVSYIPRKKLISIMLSEQSPYLTLREGVFKNRLINIVIGA